MQGITKTNKTIATFTAADIDELVANNEIAIEQEIEHGVAQSDYVQAIGESVNPAYEKPKNTMQVATDIPLYNLINDYIMGLKVVVRNRLKDKAQTTDLYTFEKNNDPVWQVYTSRFYRGFLEYAYGNNKELATRHIKDIRNNAPRGFKQKLVDFDKQQFLAYAYIALGGTIPPNVKFMGITNSIKVTSGRLNGIVRPRVKRIREGKETTNKLRPLLAYNKQHDYPIHVIYANADSSTTRLVASVETGIREDSNSNSNGNITE
jgi:hypothetical protein